MVIIGNDGVVFLKVNVGEYVQYIQPFASRLGFTYYQLRTTPKYRRFFETTNERVAQTPTATTILGTMLRMRDAWTSGARGFRWRTPPGQCQPFMFCQAQDSLITGMRASFVQDIGKVIPAPGEIAEGLRERWPDIQWPLSQRWGWMWEHLASAARTVAGKKCNSTALEADVLNNRRPQYIDAVGEGQINLDPETSFRIVLIQYLRGGTFNALYAEELDMKVFESMATKLVDGLLAGTKLSKTLATKLLRTGA